jgi:predicted RNase H-like nuclease
MDMGEAPGNKVGARSFRLPRLQTAHQSSTKRDEIEGTMTTQWLAGMDGCKAGWIVALVRPDGEDVRIRVLPRFVDLFAEPETPAIVAIDVPIGLPEHIGPGGRGPERAVRPLLGERQSSVFAVPSRPAIYSESYGDACRMAAETSVPPRKVSKQLYMIAPKIREIDTELRNAPTLVARVFEVHPEVAFWRLNGAQALTEPKKVKGQPYGPGLVLRRALLTRHGFAQGVVEADPPRGAAADDLLDALACAAIARRIHAGLATPYPNPPLRDGFGLPIAIWA